MQQQTRSALHRPLKRQHTASAPRWRQAGHCSRHLRRRVSCTAQHPTSPGMSDCSHHGGCSTAAACCRHIGAAAASSTRAMHKPALHLTRRGGLPGTMTAAWPRRAAGARERRLLLCPPSSPSPSGPLSSSSQETSGQRTVACQRSPITLPARLLPPWISQSWVPSSSGCGIMAPACARRGSGKCLPAGSIDQ